MSAILSLTSDNISFNRDVRGYVGTERRREGGREGEREGERERWRKRREKERWRGGEKERSVSE